MVQRAKAPHTTWAIYPSMTTVIAITPHLRSPLPSPSNPVPTSQCHPMTVDYYCFCCNLEDYETLMVVGSALEVVENQ